MIVASPNVGKSWFAARIAASVISGKCNIDGSPYEGKIGKVLLIDFEQDAGAYVERFRLMNVDPANLIFPYYEGESDNLKGLDNEETQRRIREAALSGDIVMIIVDSLSSGTTGKDENSSAMLGPTRFLASIAEQCDVPVLLIHHAGKRTVDSNGPGIHHARGHSSITQMARGCIMLDNPIPSRTDIVRARVVKNNRSPRAPELAYKVEDGKFNLVDLDEEIDNAKRDNEPIGDRPFTEEESRIYNDLKKPGTAGGLSLREAEKKHNVSFGRVRSIKNKGDRFYLLTQNNTTTQNNTLTQGVGEIRATHQSSTPGDSSSPEVSPLNGSNQ